jgi:ABC-type nitrate/sulfonate/bicarbonate transport system permease component
MASTDPVNGKSSLQVASAYENSNMKHLTLVAQKPSPSASMTGSKRPYPIALPWISVLTLFVVLQVLVYAEVLPSRSFPLMTDIFAALLREGATFGFWDAVRHTLEGWAIGLLLVMLTAVPLGIFLGSSRICYRASRTLIEFLRPVPSVALIPLAVLVFGTGLHSKVFLVTFAAFWPMLIQTIYGVQDTDPTALDMARTFGLGRMERLWHITLPGTAPFIATGFRIASATALILAVTAELVIGSPGLGASIEIARSGGAVATAYAMILATGILGCALNSGALRIEKSLLHWHPSQRAGAST